MYSNLLSRYAEVPQIALETGYKMRTTFWGDFRVCDKSITAIKDTFNRAFNGYKDDQEYGTELAMVLNWLSWFYENDQELCRTYAELWHKMDGYIVDNWKGEKLSYYLRTTD